MQKPSLIAVVGPTASGKSALGVYLAQKIHGEIISADSRQVYKGLTIGTGKITKKEMAGVPHHLLDIVSPKKIFTASNFVTQGKKAIAEIYKKKRTPIVVGGTGLYVDALLGRFVIPEVPPNAPLRARLEKKTVANLYLLLKQKDPRRAKTIEPHNKRRIIRALEIATALGENPLPQKDPNYKVLWLGIQIPDTLLRKRIHTRLIARMKEGMVAEAKRLHAQGLSYKRMQELGLEYQFLALLLENKITRNEFMEGLERAIIRYTKSQMRWFKRNPDIVWVKNKSEALAYTKKFLTGA